MAFLHDFGAYQRHDIRQGVVRRWRYFLIAAVIFALICGQLWQRHHGLMQQEDLARKYGVEAALSLGDYWCYLFQGTEIFVAGDPHFRVNMLWVLIPLYLAFAVGFYPFQDLTGYGQHLLLRAKSRPMWWLSKCIWLVVSVAAFYVVAACTIVLFGLLSGAQPTWLPHPGVQMYFSQIDVGNGQSSFLAAALLLPPVSSLALSALQMVVSLLTRPLMGMVAIAALLSACVFYASPWLPGNYQMLMRVSFSQTGGYIRPVAGFLLCGVLLLLSAAAGAAVVRRKDILNNTD